MEAIRDPKIISELGIIGAAQSVLSGIFLGDFDPHEPETETESFRRASLKWLKELMDKEDVHPKQILHLLLGRHLIAHALFESCVNIVSLALVDESFSVRKEEEVELPYSFCGSILFLDFVRFLWRPGTLLKEEGFNHFFDTSLPTEWHVKSIRRILNSRTTNKKKSEFNSWLSDIECLELKQKKFTNSEIFERVLRGVSIASNQSDAVTKAVKRAEKRIFGLLDGQLTLSSF
jgi:hypothetical protein